MKKFSKRFFALFLSLALVIGMIPATFAADTADVSVEIVTDKDSYEVGEKAVVTVKVTNNTDEAISDVKVEITLPSGLELADGYSKDLTIASIAAGASDEVKVEANVVKAPYTGDSSVVFPFILLAIAAVVVILFAKSKKLRNVANIGAVLLVIGIAGLAVPVVVEAASGEVTAKKEVKVDGNTAEIIAKVTYTTGASETTDDKEDDSTTSETVNHVTVHDPSIVKDPETGMYYIFGSHMAWAKSEDLINWTTFTNNINRDYKTLFADAAEWSAKGGTQGSSTGAYDVSGNLWAPDVVYNEAMGKWCMYMSVNGAYWYTSVVMLTADSLEGDWTVVGPVVYSGFTNATEAAETDFYDVYTGTDFPDRYTSNRNGNRTYGMNAIDPCVFYDEDGKLWMVYGSWFGGVYMIELDPATGLRLASHTYETVDNESDEYQGIKIAGGNNVSGEAPYIVYNDGYYYLYVTLGGLVANGGYNMRVIRSENVEGPYTDLTGNDARYSDSNTRAGTINGSVGNRVMSYYKWDYMDYGYVAQGHNSALVDDDGKMYVVYHTRFDNMGEGHQVRVHQQFVNEDGWLVTAPFEYYNETLTEVEATDVVGPYSVLVHKLSIDYANKECVESVSISLNEDGSITGDLTGDWEFGTDGAPYVTMTIGNYTYKGVFVEQKMEESSTRTMTFTVLGNDEINIWGYRLAGADEELAQEAADALTMPIGAMTDVTLPASGLNATTITWESANTDIIANDGKVTRPETDTVVTLTATVTYGTASVEKDFEVKVFAEYDTTEDKVIWTYAEDGIDLSSAVQGTYQYANPLNEANVVGLNINSGVSIKFHVSDATADAWTNNILSFNTNATGGLWVNDMSYLGYNATGYFDANLHNGSYSTGAWTAGTNFIADECDVEIKLTVMGFEYYVDGELVYSNADVPSDEVPGEIASGISYLNVLSYLNDTATVLNFGWGGFWEGGFKGTVSDVEISVLGIPEENVDTSDYVWYEFFTLGDLSAWNAPTILSKITLENAGTDRGNYVHVGHDGGSGNRNAYMTFDSEANVSGTYRVSVDATLTAGVLAQRSVSTFAISGTDIARVTNGDITGGYIVKLTNQPPSTSAANTNDYSKQNKWTINDANNTEVTIPVGAWVNITADVDTNEGKAYVVITDGTDSETVYYEGVVLINGSGELGGLDVLVGRGVGKYDVDSITVELLDEVEFPEEDVEDIIRYTTLVEYDFTNSNVPEDVTFSTNVTATEAGAKLADGYIELPSDLFSTLPDDAKSLVVEITYSKQANTVFADGAWSERLFNFTDDSNTDDGVQNGTNGLYMSVNGNVGTTKNPYGDGTAYMDGKLTVTNDVKSTVKMELNFETNTASLYKDGTLVYSGTSTADAITVANLKNFTINSIGRSTDMWAMWGFMTVESFKVSYGAESAILADYDFKNSNVPEDVTFSTNVTATEAGAKLADGYIELPSDLFSTLPDDAKSLVVEITYSKQANTVFADGAWSERLFNFTDDSNTDDGVQNGTNGLYMSVNGNVGTTKNPYGDGTAYMDGKLTVTNDVKSTVKMELNFETNTASLYKDGTLVYSGTSTADAITVADLKNFTINSIGRSTDMWAMWGFMTVESFTVSYK